MVEPRRLQSQHDRQIYAALIVADELKRIVADDDLKHLLKKR